MNEIILKRANVVKSVDSEDKAKVLEAKGFIRTDGKSVKKSANNAAEKRGELEKELADTKEKLEKTSEYAAEADKKIEALTQELAGTREQLEAAVKKNKTADKK